jgi:hypothetical protein
MVKLGSRNREAHLQHDRWGYVELIGSSCLFGSQIFPIFDWISTYRREWLAPDVLPASRFGRLWFLREWHMRALLVFRHGALHVSASIGCLCAIWHLAPARRWTGYCHRSDLGADRWCRRNAGTAEFNLLTSTLSVLIGVFFFLLAPCVWGGSQALFPHL